MGEVAENDPQHIIHLLGFLDSSSAVHSMTPPAEDVSSLQRNRLKLQYRPGTVRVLFIGEAPPASGKFFYQRDSGLYRAIRDAFRLVDSSVTDANFLQVFQASGCYLIDLCGRPVDKLDLASRRALCLEAEPTLCQTLLDLKPETIVIMLRSIRGNVQRATDCASWAGEFVELPYPGRWWKHREAFLSQLRPLLERILIR
jgi:hypothetical protein